MRNTRRTKRKNPVYFQGRLEGSNYFEGWYFKQVDQTGKHTIAFIPGISLDHDDRHCFIQVIVTPEVKTYYYRFPIEAFKVQNEPFMITIADNVFTLTQIQIALEDDFRGRFEFGKLSDIEKTLLSPDIMGFFSYIPGMECNHGIISLNHAVSGQMKVPSGETVDFETSFMCSIATIPFGVFAFDGLIANLKYGGKEYRFATYNGTKVKDFIATEDAVNFELIKGKQSLKVAAKVQGHGQLKAPLQGEMVRTIKEGLGGEVTLVLSIEGKEVASLYSSCAGIEIALQGRLANSGS